MAKSKQPLKDRSVPTHSLPAAPSALPHNPGASNSQRALGGRRASGRAPGRWLPLGAALLGILLISVYLAQSRPAAQPSTAARSARRLRPSRSSNMAILAVRRAAPGTDPAF